MTEIYFELTRELFQLMKRFPRPSMALSPRQDMTRSEYEFLGILAMRLGGTQTTLSIGEISGILQVTPAAATHLVNALEQMGLLERQKAPNDRRVVLIAMTSQGIEVAEELMSEIQEQLSGLIDFLGEEDSNTLIRLMTKVIDYIATQPSAKGQIMQGISS
jgi:DNA-binding MarR family transcriptional regulator